VSVSASPARYPSAQAFHATVLELDPKVAVFDCDGTLWSGDAGSSFMRYTLHDVPTGILSAEKTQWLNERYAAYRDGKVSELAICGEMVQVYEGLPVELLRDTAATFFRTHIERHIFPDMLELVTELQRRGTEIWAVSSTCDWVIEEGVKRFGIPADRVLAACVETVDAVASSNLRDVPTDEGKVTSLRRVGIAAPDAVFGNSVHDAAMLAIARRAFPVNPTPALEDRSAREDWTVFFPGSAAQ
jgi:phosphoserine phosphatase